MTYNKYNKKKVNEENERKLDYTGFGKVAILAKICSINLNVRD